MSANNVAATTPDAHLRVGKQKRVEAASSNVKKVLKEEDDAPEVEEEISEEIEVEEDKIDSKQRSRVGSQRGSSRGSRETPPQTPPV